MANDIKRKYYNGQHYFIDEVNKVVKLLPEFHDILLNKKLWGGRGFKKIGGSSVGDVLLTDAYKSQFAAFCRMADIAIPVLDRKHVDAGIAIEHKVIEAVEQLTKHAVQTFPGPQYGYDYFKDKDDVVGGLPDGYIKEMNLIIEIKTAGEKKFDSWVKFGAPAGYQKQAQLYAYLMGADRFSIVATFLRDEDYANPENYPIKERKLKNWSYNVNIPQAEDDIKKIKEFYYKHTQSGVSPQYKESLDADMLEWLKCSNESEWEELKQRWINQGKLVI